MSEPINITIRDFGTIGKNHSHLSWAVVFSFLRL